MPRVVYDPSKPLAPDNRPIASIVQKDAETVAEANKRRLGEAVRKADRRLKGAEMGFGDTVGDVGKQIGVGGTGAVTGWPGQFADVIRAGQLAKARVESWRSGRPMEAVLREMDEVREKKPGEWAKVFKPSNLERSGSAASQKAAAPSLPEGLNPTNPDNDPYTVPGQIARTVSDFATSALTGGVGHMLESGITGGVRAAGRTGVREVALGTLSGAAVAGTELAGGGSGAQTAAGLVTGPLAALYRRRPVDAAVRAAAGNVTPAQVDAAEAIFARAQRENLPVSKAQALDLVTRGGSNLSELQRVVEGGNSDTFRRFFAESAGPGPTRVRAAVQGDPNATPPRPGLLTDVAGAPSPEPGTIGPRAAASADRMIQNAETNVNQATRPQYQAIEGVPLDPPVLQGLMADPKFAATAQRIQNDPNHASFLASSARPGTVGWVDYVNQAMRREQEELRAGTSPGGNQAAAGIEPAIATGEQAANTASRQLPPGAGVPPGPSPLEEVRRDQAELRQANVEPLQQGTPGRLAEAKTTEAAQQAVFPAQPLEGSHVDAGRTVQHLVQENPELGEQFVRNYLGTKFEAAARPTLAGEPGTAGTRFWRDVAGGEESQTRRNLQATMEALPNGAARWQVMREMGELFEAMGKRQAPGSKTASNIEAQEALKAGGRTEAVAKAASGGFLNLGKQVADGFERWRLGRNQDEIAALFTDPSRAEDFRRILEAPAGSMQRVYRIGRLLSTGDSQSGPTRAALAATVNDPGFQFSPESR